MYDADARATQWREAANVHVNIDSYTVTRIEEEKKKKKDRQCETR